MNENNSIGLESLISAVTIFKDRAQVTRTAKISLEIGEHLLLFDKLPRSVEEKSIQVNGKGNAILRDVKFKQTYYAEIPNTEIKKIYDELQKLQDEKLEITDKINQANKEKTFIENITTKLTSTNEKSNSTQLDPDKWVKMVEFYRSKQESIDNEIRNANIKNRSIDKKINKIQQEIENINDSQYKTKNQVEVLIEVKEASEVILDLSYIVYGPTWQPFYDLRVSSNNKRMHITYNALICQNTTENWDNVQISLSTAQPNISGQQPELAPWHISKMDHHYFDEMSAMPLGSAMEKTRGISSSPKKAKQMMPSEEAEDFEPLSQEEAPELDIESSDIETKATSVVFNVPGKNNIISDNHQHKVTIMMYDFPVHFRYSSVPKLAPYAYLKAKVINKTDYPFLAGATNVFLDNNFVANAKLDLVVPGEEFWTFLGVDESLKIEHKFLKKYHTQAGVFSKFNKFTYEYLITIINNKQSEEELVIWDQLPISEHEKIKINLISPEFKENNKNIKKNEDNFLEWFYKVKPAEKIEINFKFAVEYPEDMQITGL